jgi:hypothetical protein
VANTLPVHQKAVVVVMLDILVGLKKFVVGKDVCLLVQFAAIPLQKETSTVRREHIVQLMELMFVLFQV